MHVPDGFLDLPTSITCGAVAVVAVGVALRSLGRRHDDRWPVRAGLTAAFVFAAQMVNFPVGAGTSGHLIGAALASALLGPAAAIVVMTCVLVVQALVFADGGLTALGTNTVLLAVVAVLVAHGVQSLVAASIRDRGRAASIGSAVGALVSVPATALVFSALYAVGGAVPVPVGLLTGTMLGVHGVIGVGEAIITWLCVRVIMSLRPDLVALGQKADAAVRRPLGEVRRLGWAVLVASLVVAGGVSLLASTSPDGLEWSAEQLGFGAAAQDSATAGSPLADYGLGGVAGWGRSIAGVSGVVLTLGLAVGSVALVVRRRREQV